MADLLSRYGFTQEAEGAYKARMAGDPGRPERMLDLAGFLGRQGRIPEAMALLKKAWARYRPRPRRIHRTLVL